jgi:hypothetical protein
VFTARYALSPYVKQIRFAFKGLKEKNCASHEIGSEIARTNHVALMLQGAVIWPRRLLRRPVTTEGRPEATPSEICDRQST